MGQNLWQAIIYTKISLLMSGGCSSNEEHSEVPSYLGIDELHPQDLNALDRAVTSADRGSSDECEDDEVIKLLCLLFLQRMRIKIRTW